jgi:hypothetical protein
MRLVAALTLVASLASTAAAQRFAQPPVASVSATAPRNIRPSDNLPPPVTRDAVRTKLIAARTANLGFRAYQQKGVFPNNTYQPTRLNVWRDDAGNFCAAATIIRMSGQTALVDKVADQNNFIKLADVRQGPLMDWILTSGMTQEEIAAIQEPMSPIYDEPEPDQPRIVDARMRAAENQRLIAVYKSVDAMIVKNAKASIDIAIDRLMGQPGLAFKFVNG